MGEAAYEVTAPWRLDERAEIILTVREKSLLGSAFHVARFDMYPVHAPSHPERHHGYWDIPMEHVRKERTVLTLKKGKLCLDMPFPPLSFPPVWRGDLPFSGTCILTASILDMASEPVQTLWTRSSVHLLPKSQDLPLVRATLYITRRCHLRCDLCWREFFKGGEDIDTPAEVIDAVVAESPRLASVLLHGDGEPLLNPRLPDIVATLKRTMSSKGKVGLQTNGMLLNRNMARDLMDRGLDWLSVSIDGAKKATVEGIRRGSRFDMIVENLRYAVQYARRARSGDIQFTIQFTMRESNIRELPALVRLAGGLGVDNVSAALLISYDTGEFCAVPARVLDQVYEEARSVGREQNVRLVVQTPRPFEDQRCHFLQEAYIHVSGDVAICCFRKPGNPERPQHIFGNVKDTPLSTIWSSPGCREFRRALVDGAFPQGCDVCGFKVWGCPTPV